MAFPMVGKMQARLLTTAWRDGCAGGWWARHTRYQSASSFCEMTVSTSSALTQVLSVNSSEAWPRS